MSKFKGRLRILIVRTRGHLWGTHEFRVANDDGQYTDVLSKIENTADGTQSRALIRVCSNATIFTHIDRARSYVQTLQQTYTNSSVKRVNLAQSWADVARIAKSSLVCDGCDVCDACLMEETQTSQTLRRAVRSEKLQLQADAQVQIYSRLKQKYLHLSEKLRRIQDRLNPIARMRLQEMSLLSNA